MDPKSFDVAIERGVLSMSGERTSELPAQSPQVSVHMNERYAGRFQRAVSLSDDVDPDRVEANYSDGVLHISIKRRESAQPRRIEVH